MHRICLIRQDVISIAERHSYDESPTTRYHIMCMIVVHVSTCMSVELCGATQVILCCILYMFVVDLSQLTSHVELTNQQSELCHTIVSCTNRTVYATSTPSIRARRFNTGDAAIDVCSID
jgi:hypothetical protein